MEGYTIFMDQQTLYCQYANFPQINLKVLHNSKQDASCIFFWVEIDKMILKKLILICKIEESRIPKCFEKH